MFVKQSFSELYNLKASIKTYFFTYSTPAFSTSREGAKEVFRDAFNISLTNKLTLT
jgi:hypothetical protein